MKSPMNYRIGSYAISQCYEVLMLIIIIIIIIVYFFIVLSSLAKQFRKGIRYRSGPFRVRPEANVCEAHRGAERHLRVF